MYQGFLFDLDGTLVDSLAVVEDAWTTWGAQHNLSRQEILDFIHGKPAIASLRHFLSGADEETVQREFDLLERIEAQNVQGIKALPGARELLVTLTEQQIPWAIVTSGSVPVAQARYQKLDLPKPDVFITAEKVKRGKPAPDPYILGAQQLGLSPAHCVVVEDALAGIQAGLAAGCTVVAVNAPANHPPVSFALSSLEQLSVKKTPQGFTLEQVG